MPPSKRALQQLRNKATSRYISMTTFSEFCDQAGDAVLLQIVSSCDDPGDMFAIIVGIKRFAVCASPEQIAALWVQRRSVEEQGWVDPAVKAVDKVKEIVKLRGAATWRDCLLQTTQLTYFTKEKCNKSLAASNSTISGPKLSSCNLPDRSVRNSMP